MTLKVYFEEKKARLIVDDAVTDKTQEEALQKAWKQYKGKVAERKLER